MGHQRAARQYLPAPRALRGAAGRADRSRVARARTMLWARKLRPVPGVSHPPLRPLKPSVTAYITWGGFMGLEGSVRELPAHGAMLSEHI